MRNYVEILKHVKENAISKYDEFKEKTNDDDKGEEMIIFTSRTVGARTINYDRDEDTDEYIGIKKNGWIIYTHDIEYSGGPIKIKNKSINNVSEESIMDSLDKYTDEQYIRFMAKVCKFYSKY